MHLSIISGINNRSDAPSTKIALSAKNKSHLVNVRYFLIKSLLSGFSCANEFKFLGLKNVEAHNGKVTFEGDFSDMAKANINSRYAERIQILLAEFEAVSFEELFEGVKSVAWEDFIGVNDAFPVKGRCLSSKLMSVPDCQKIIKKAVVTRLSEKYMLPWLEESGPLHQIQFLIMNDKVSVMLDTSGAGLHKRGYRAESNEAPIKETLAAAMADLSRVRGNHFVVDPMCGSGTILIEAALKAMKIAPGINRYFAAEKWNCVPSDVWKEQKLQKQMKSVIAISVPRDMTLTNLHLK